MPGKTSILYRSVTAARYCLATRASQPVSLSCRAWKPPDLSNRARASGSKRHPVAVFLAEREHRPSGFDHREIARLLPDTKTLRQRMRPGAAETFDILPGAGRVERAFADGLPAQGTLKENCVMDGAAGVFRHGRMMPRLRGPDRIELVLEHRPCRIEIIVRRRSGRLVARADRRAHLMTPVQEFAERPRAQLLHQRLQFAGGALDRAGFLAACFGLSVRKEAAPLVQME